MHDIDERLQDEAWRKEAVVLWEYVDRLVAAWDLRTAAHDPSVAAGWDRAPGASGRPRAPPARPQPACSTGGRAHPLGHAFAGDLVVSGGLSRDSGWQGGRRVAVPAPHRGCAACAGMCAAEDRRPRGGPSAGRAQHDSGAVGGPLDARGLARVLSAVNAVESYLHCTDRIHNLPEAAAEGSEAAGVEHDHGAAAPQV